MGHCGLKYPNAGDFMLPRRSGPARGRFPEFCRLCGRLLHNTGGLAGMPGVHSSACFFLSKSILFVSLFLSQLVINQSIYCQ